MFSNRVIDKLIAKAIECDAGPNIHDVFINSLSNYTNTQKDNWKSLVFSLLSFNDYHCQANSKFTSN